MKADPLSHLTVIAESLVICSFFFFALQNKCLLAVYSPLFPPRTCPLVMRFVVALHLRNETNYVAYYSSFM